MYKQNVDPYLFNCSLQHFSQDYKLASLSTTIYKWQNLQYDVAFGRQELTNSETISMRFIVSENYNTEEDYESIDRLDIKRPQ